MKLHRKYTLLFLFCVALLCFYSIQSHQQNLLNARLMGAIVRNDTQRIQWLLNQGASPNAPDTLLPGCGINEKMKVAFGRMLGRSNNDFLCDSNYTVLMRAVQYGDKEAVTLLIDYGADIHAKDYAGRTAYDWAVRWKRNEVIVLFHQLASPLKK